MTVYSIPELPELIGSEKQIAYASDIRAGQVRAIQGLLPDGTPSTGRPFREMVYDVLARSAGLDRARIMSHPPVDAAIQDAIDSILGQVMAEKIINNTKKGTFSERVAFSAQRRMGW